MSAAFRFPGTLEGPELARLWELGCTGAAQEGGEVVAYFDKPLEAEMVPAEVRLTGHWEEVDGKDWVADYYATLEPVPIGRLVVAPTHREVTLTAGQRALWLDPGMAFGSGHHETTFLALQALEGCNLLGKRVLDVGAGSGILAIAADLLGASYALGIDIDPQTVPVAEANAALNLSKAHFAVCTLDDEAPADAPAANVPDDTPADIVVANLYAELHAALAPAYVRVLKPGGELFATGILDERGAVALESLGRHLELLDVRQKGEWLLIHARKVS